MAPTSVLPVTEKERRREEKRNIGPRMKKVFLSTQNLSEHEILGGPTRENLVPNHLDENPLTTD